MIACDEARSSWPCARAVGPVIHWEVPSAHAMAPSAALATLSTVHGRPVRRW